MIKHKILNNEFKTNLFHTNQNMNPKRIKNRIDFTAKSLNYQLGTY